MNNEIILKCVRYIGFHKKKVVTHIYNERSKYIIEHFFQILYAMVNYRDKNHSFK